MKADQKKLYEFMENPDGSTNYAVAAAYFGSAILDPAGWLLPITKAKTLYVAAKYGFVSAGIAGGLGYVDEESILNTRGKQAAASAVGGTILSPVMKGVGKKLKGEKVFTRESLGIPGFDAPSVKVQADTELQKIKLQNAAGQKHRTAEARKKIEVDEPETIKDMVSDKSKLLRGPRHWFRENVVKPYEIKLLADQLIADSEKAWKANQPPKIDIGDITGEELMSGDLGNHIVYDETVSEDSQINPTANMLATFDRITQNERERISDYDDIQRTNGIIIDSITGAPR